MYLDSCQTPASSRVCILNAGSPKGGKSAHWVSPQSFKQMFALRLLSRAPDGSRSWLLPPADPRITRQHVSHAAQEGGRKEQAWARGEAPGVQRYLINAHREPEPSQRQRLPAFPTYTQFSKRWSCFTRGRRSVCCQLAWLYNNLFQPLPMATSTQNFTSVTQ